MGPDPYVPEYLRKMRNSKGMKKILLFVALPVFVIIGAAVMLLMRRRK